jgi:hypothetical protein
MATTSYDRINLSYTIQLYGFIALLIVGYALLILLAVYARDLERIRQHPFKFAFETLLVGAGLALPFYYFGYWRGLSMKETHAVVFGLFIKFVSLHVLLQISGFYGGLHGDVMKPL